MSGMSVATIKSPEFINVTSVSPLISKCEIKVFYLGQNRNRSAINKEVATQMAQTLPGTPIVGYYSENAEDFRDHGEQIVLDGDGVKFNCLTKPYGFVDINTKVWFKEFEDTDDFGNKVTREYLMCEGYLWTEQYEEAKKVINEGRPHSMELDENTLKGYWSTDSNRGIDFFIINDATISKLCILGEDVEPCFEGSSVTKPDVSASFSKDAGDFTKSLYTMMQELKEYTYSLKSEGGSSMEENTNVVAQELDGAASAEAEAASVENTENFSNSEDNSNSENINENQNITEEFKKTEDEEEKKDDSNSEGSDAKSDDETGAGKENEEDDEEKKKAAKNTLAEDYALLQEQFEELQSKFSALEEQNKELLEFKLEIENQKKDELIKSFYMLSDEDKKDVIDNKASYSLDDIESKLSVICVRKKVNFNLEDEAKQTEDSPAVTFNLNSAAENDSIPAWIKAVESYRNENAD